MPAPPLAASGHHPPEQGRGLVRLLLIAGAGLFLLALALWAKFGAAVFIETMATAWAYCF